MKKEWVLSQDAFDTLLNWLDADRERAGNKYEAIRLRLIKIFTCRGFWEAEEMADETINRVVARVADLATDYQGDPALYFFGVSQKVQLEYLRKSRLRDSEVSADVTANLPSPADSVLVDDAEPEYECLERCLEHLPPNNRKIVLEYYQQERRAKIDHRKLLAAELGIAVNALRIRAHRIRRALEICVRECLEQQPAH
jgi:DNA-directed RNA polymerase specialized sigma24 family protein